MKRFISLVLVLLTCCCTMAFFTGCDSGDKYVIIISGRSTFTQINRNLSYLEIQQLTDGYLTEMRLEMYDKKTYKEGGSNTPLDLGKEFPSLKDVISLGSSTAISLYDARQEGANIANFNVFSETEYRELVVTFKGCKSKPFAYKVSKSQGS